MTVAVSRGNTVVATVSGSGAWANATAAAVCDGTPGTFDTATCTWTSSTASDVGSITIGGYLFGLVGVEAILACSILVNHFENNTSHITSITAQLQTATGAAIGAAQTVALATVATSTVVTPSVLPTTAQAFAGLRVLITDTNGSGTTSRVYSIDNVDVTLTYAALPGGLDTGNVNRAPMIRASAF